MRALGVLSGWPADTEARKKCARRSIRVQPCSGHRICIHPRVRSASDLKNSLLAQAAPARVRSSPIRSLRLLDSHSVALLQGSYSDPEVAAARTRVCDIGLLRESYATRRQNRLSLLSEPVANYVAKGGNIEETVGRKCLCNALMANIGHQQTRKDGSVEPALVTIGDDLNTVVQFMAPGRASYSAADVVASLLSLSAEETADEQLIQSSPQPDRPTS